MKSACKHIGWNIISLLGLHVCFLYFTHKGKQGLITLGYEFNKWKMRKHWQDFFIEIYKNAP